MRIFARLTVAATEASRFPLPTLPEVAFLGRSNVGKSSVINSLVGKKLARTSSIPGRTRSLNFFELRWAGQPQAELIFTDLPGYGYARLPREISARWPEFVEPYLKHRPSLILCLALIDVNVPLQESDRQLIRFLTSIGRPLLILGTKSDRLSSTMLPQVLRALAEEFRQATILPYSARTGAGRDELWREIRRAALLRQTQSELARQ
ncbi:MAG TPA: ribosome biogenesis GTP-binding protein YihA/YsxC [Terriglobales bacterium]|nr:ribosome biogenesis GTP-binding protein YihA/YsxC [Terriglobales bacterium]